MSGNFQVRSQGPLWSHALKRLLGAQKHHFGRKIVQLIQKWSWNFFRRKGFRGFGTSGLKMIKPWNSEIVREALRGINFSLPFLNLLDNFDSKIFKLQEVFSEFGIRVWEPI
jgi:hypothetical protein